jgi:hypothetical protein
LVSAALVAACTTTSPTSHQSDAAVFEQVTLTNDNADIYTFTTGDGAVTVNAPPTNQGLNLRMLFWPAAGRVATDSGSCAEWTSETGIAQQGAVMRVATLPNRGLRAILVTKNIWFSGVFNFNVYIVDTTQVAMLKRIGYVSLRGELLNQDGAPQPLPWFMCARVSGDQVAILVWHSGEPAPRWGDPSHGGSVTLPAGWIYPGKAGWYIGHVPAGGSAGFTNLSTSATLGRATQTTTVANHNMVFVPMEITRAARTLEAVSTPAVPH